MRNNPFYDGGAIQLLRNDGGQSFVDDTTAAFGNGGYGQPFWITFLRVLDLNGDGIDDIFPEGGMDDGNREQAFMYNREQAFMYISDGDGGFVPVPRSAVIQDPAFDFLGSHVILVVTANGVEFIGAQYCKMNTSSRVSKLLNQPASISPEPLSPMTLVGTFNPNTLEGVSGNDTLRGIDGARSADRQWRE